MKSLQAVAKIAFATTALPLYFLPIISLNKNGFAEGVVIHAATPAPTQTKEACDGLQLQYQAAKRELLRDLETNWGIVYEKGNVAAFQQRMHALLRDHIGRDVGQGGNLRKKVENVVGALSDEAEAESVGESSVDEEERASRGSEGGAAAEGLFWKFFVRTAKTMLQHHEPPDEEARRNSGEGSEQRDTPEERASYSLADISAFLKKGNGSREKFDKVLYAPCVLVKKIHSALTLLEHAVLTRVDYQEKCRCELCTVSRFFSVAEPAPAATRNQCKCKPHGASDDLHVNAARVWRGFLDPAYTALNAVQTLRGACKKMRQTYRTLGGRLRTLVSVLQDHARGAALSRRLEDTSVESVSEHLGRMTLAGEAEADSDRDLDDDWPEEPILGGAFEAEAQTTPERTGWEVASLSVLQGRLEEAKRFMNSGPRLDVLEARLKELETAAKSYDEKQAGALVLNRHSVGTLGVPIHSKIGASSSSTMARKRRELRQKSAQWLDLHEDYMMEAGRQSFAENARESRNSIVNSLAKFLGKFLGGDTPTAEGTDSGTSTTPYRFAVFRFEGKTVRSEEAKAAASSWSSASSPEDGAVDALHGYQMRRQQFAVVALRIPGRGGPPSPSATRRTTVRDVFDAPGDERERKNENYAGIADRIVLVLLYGRKKDSFKLEEGSGKKNANEPRKPVLLPLDTFPAIWELGPHMHQTQLPFSFLRSILLDPNFRRFERSAVRSFVEALERAPRVDSATATEVEADSTLMIRFQGFAEELRKRFHLNEEGEMLAREIWGEAMGRHLLMPTEVAPPFSVRFFPTAPRAPVVPDEIIANDDKMLKAAGADKGLMLEVSRRFFDRVLNYEEEPANEALAEATRKWLAFFTSSGDRISPAGGGETMQAWGGGGAAGNPTLRFELELANSAFQYSLRSVDHVVDAVKAASMQVERSILRSATVFSIPLGETGKARGKEQALFAKSFGVVGLKSGVLQFPHATLSESPMLFTPGAQVQTRLYKWQRQDWVPAEEWAAGVVGGAGHGHLAHLGLKAVPLFLSGEGGASSSGSHDQDSGALGREDPRNSATQQWQYGPKRAVVIGSNAAWREWTAHGGALLKAERDWGPAEQRYLKEWEHWVDLVARRRAYLEAVPAEECSQDFLRTKLQSKLREQEKGRRPSTNRTGGLQQHKPPAVPAKYRAASGEIPSGERCRWIPATSDALWREARSLMYGGTYMEPVLLGEEEEEGEDELHDVDDENVVGKRFILAFKAWAEERRTQQASGVLDRAWNGEGPWQTGVAFDDKSNDFLRRFCDDSMLGRTSGARFGVVSYDLQAMPL